MNLSKWSYDNINEEIREIHDKLMELNMMILMTRISDIENLVGTDSY
jgi:hypothetical protein